MNRMVAGAAVAVLMIAGASPASAQAFGLPVTNSGLPTGIGLALDVGKPNDAAGGGWSAGATGKAGFGRFGLTGSVSLTKPSLNDDLWSTGATANMQVFGGPLIPLSVNLQAGAGFFSEDIACIPEADCDPDRWHFPVGLGFAFTIPNPAMAIKPWVAPRLDIVRAGGTTHSNVGASAGVELNFITGLGLHAAYDWVNGDVADPGIFAAGLHYTFRVPGL